MKRFELLSDDLLIDSYLKAIRLDLDNDFIGLLLKEIERRNIKIES